MEKDSGIVLEERSADPVKELTYFSDAGSNDADSSTKKAAILVG